jgi:hypothetical protein
MAKAAAAALGSLLVLLAPMGAFAATLQGQTLAAWDHYKKLTEARIERELSSSNGFLVRDFFEPSDAAAIRSAIRTGVFVRRMETRNEEGGKIDVPDGLIHHWYGTVLVPGAKLDDVVRWEQDYPHHQDYFHEVEASRLISRKGDVFDIFLKLRRKKVITVFYDTEHVVTYRRLGDDREVSRSEATRIAELENAGTPNEKEKPEGEDQGFLWRLNSYWRFQQEEDGVVVECESISLSRTIPLAMRWLVKPFINSVPKESLEATLAPLRKAFEAGSAGAGSLPRNDVECGSLDAPKDLERRRDPDPFRRQHPVEVVDPVH